MSNYTQNTANNSLQEEEDGFDIKEKIGRAHV